MSHTESELTGATVLRWARNAAVAGLLLGVAAGIVALMTP